MKKLRFLLGAYIPSIEKTVNVNDELDLDDKLADECLKLGIADELKPELNEKPVKKTARKPKKVAEDNE